MPLLASGAELFINIETNKGLSQLVFSLDSVSDQQFFSAMDEGYSVEIEYRFRLREEVNLGIMIPPKGAPSTIKIKMTGKKDFLTGGYFIIRDGRRDYYNSRESFCANFFSCRTEIPAVYYETVNCYIEARAVADILKRPPPMQLLDMFYLSELIRTDWRQLGNF